MFRELVIKRALRSNKWPKVRALHIERENACVACGKKHWLQVHHIKPVHLFPELELEDSNLLTLCRRHHFIIGHLEYWKSFNSNVVRDAREWRERIKYRP
jgi:5-methylcytosine-specific restriction endonuclease McrA